jgi:hypothetical protein
MLREVTMASKPQNIEPVSHLAIPYTDGVELDFAKAVPCNSLDAAKTVAATMAAGEGQPLVAIYQAAQVVGIVSKLEPIWTPRGVG